MFLRMALKIHYCICLTHPESSREEGYSQLDKEALAIVFGVNRFHQYLYEAPSQVPYPGEVVFLLQTLQASPITAEQIHPWTNRDPVLSRVRNIMSKRWIDCFDDVLRPYHNRKDELSMMDGCVLWGRSWKSPLHLLYYIHGNGQIDLGLGSTLIMQDLFKGRLSWW